ncbi:MAG TPA: hypothetical protein PLV43_06550 [Aequorivita sp.]|nr:hypothetical protein [Aequorivita sp.]
MEKLEGKTIEEKNNGFSMLDMLNNSPQMEIPEMEAETELPEPESINEDFFNPPDRVGEEGEEEAIPRKASRNEKAKAKMAVTILDMMCSKLGAAISGENSANYKMNETDKSDFTIITMEYFATLEPDAISPALMFWATAVTIFGATLYEASEDKKARIKLQQHKEARQAAEAIRAAKVKDATVIANAFSRVEETKPEGPRRERFETDADGLFERDEKGNYVEKKDRAKNPEQHPSPEIMKIINEGKEMNMSKGEINRLCREFLYGETN